MGVLNFLTTAPPAIPPSWLRSTAWPWCSLPRAARVVGAGLDDRLWRAGRRVRRPARDHRRQLRIEAAVAQSSAEEARAAEATDKLRTAVHAWRDTQAAFCPTWTPASPRSSDAIRKQPPPLGCCCWHCPLPRATCRPPAAPAPDLPPPPPCVGDGASNSPSGWTDVLDLREALIRDRARSSNRRATSKITEPGWELKALRNRGHDADRRARPP